MCVEAYVYVPFSLVIIICSYSFALLLNSCEVVISYKRIFGNGRQADVESELRFSLKIL